MTDKAQSEINGGTLVRRTAKETCDCNKPDIEKHELRLGDAWYCGACKLGWRVTTSKKDKTPYWRRIRTVKPKTAEVEAE